MTEKPLYQLDPLNRFSDRATAYQKYRPSYPQNAIDVILSGFEDCTQLTVADIGAGTGISSRLLSDRGLRVIAIEPNAAMSTLADPDPRIEFRQATAEQTGLADQSIELVTCFQAFHWVDPGPGLQEFHRILKPQGRIALVWNNRDLSDSFTEQYGELLRQASNKHPALDRMVTVPDHPLFPTFEEHSFPLAQALDLPALIGNTKSRSYVPNQGEALDRLVEDLEVLYATHADAQGLIYMRYCTKVFITFKT